MINTKDQVKNVLFAAIDALNEQLPPESRLEKNSDTVLLGKDGKLDSVGFINLIVLIEEKFQEQLGVSLSMTDELDASQATQNGVFDRVDTLIERLNTLVEGFKKN